jgi:glycosyltransferase involved in cell wall biosynthesis
VGLGTLVTEKSIEVVLPTYNGVVYLEQQLASIDQQSLRPQRVLLRDDGSKDGTQDLVRRLQSRYGDWLTVLPSDGHLGCIANVNRLLQSTRASYVALADQDDVWLSNKLEVSLARLQQMEHLHGAETPLLVHSDLELIDAGGELLGCTYLQRQRLDPWRTSTTELALTNVVTGCTVLLNRPLLQRALPIPEEALMHDWWLALVCSVCGRLDYIDFPTVFYRQHEKNKIGAKGFGFTYMLTRISELAASNNKQWAHSVALQSRRLEMRYNTRSFHVYHLLYLSRWKRLFALMSLVCTSKLTRHGPIRSVGCWIAILCSKRLENY